VLPETLSGVTLNKKVKNNKEGKEKERALFFKNELLAL